MLKFYFATVLIWAVIIRCCIQITKEGIRKNGWLDKVKPGSGYSGLSATFCIAAIPFFRVLIVICIFVMAAVRKGEL